MLPREGSTQNTQILQPVVGLEKQQCTLQVTFRSEGKQSRLAVIFHDAGKEIPDNENKSGLRKLMYFFNQMHRWINRCTCNGGKQTLLPFIEEEGLSKFVLLTIC